MRKFFAVVAAVLSMTMLPGCQSLRDFTPDRAHAHLDAASSEVVALKQAVEAQRKIFEDYIRAGVDNEAMRRAEAELTRTQEALSRALEREQDIRALIARMESGDGGWSSSAPTELGAIAAQLLPAPFGQLAAIGLAGLSVVLTRQKSKSKSEAVAARDEAQRSERYAKQIIYGIEDYKHLVDDEETIERLHTELAKNQDQDTALFVEHVKRS